MGLTVTSRSSTQGRRSAGIHDCCNALVCQAAHAVLAAHAADAQALGIDRVGAQRGDVRVTVLSGQDGQRDRAQEIRDERRVVAGELERTSSDPVAEKTGGSQELAEDVIGQIKTSHLWALQNQPV